MVDAWEFGTAAAVAGWLMDSQTDRLIAELRAGQQQPPAPPHPAELLRGWPVDWAASPLAQGDVLERSRLGVTIAARADSGKELALEARLATTSGEMYGEGLHAEDVTFTVLVTHLVPHRRIWLTFEESPRGFSAARLLPVYDGEGPAGRAYCFVNDVMTALNALEWGLGRFHLALADFQWDRGT